MAREEYSAKFEKRYGDTAAEWAAGVSLAVFLISTWLITLNSSAPTLFIFHPILQSLGISCFTYGIVTLQPTSNPLTKAAGLTRHQWAMISGFISIVLGGTSIFLNKSVHSSPHFTSWHGTIGIISVIWMFVQILFGGASVWFNGRLLGGGNRAKSLWKYHRLSGYLIFPSLLATSHLGGGWSDWATISVLPSVRFVAFTVAPLVILGAVSSRIRTSKMRLF